MKKPIYKIIILVVFLLTVFDAACTWYGVSFGYIQEGNVLIKKLFEFNLPGTCIIIVLWTGALLCWIYSKKYKWIPYAMLLVLAVKVIIAGMHVAWLTLL